MPIHWFTFQMRTILGLGQAEAGIKEINCYLPCWWQVSNCHPCLLWSASVGSCTQKPEARSKTRHSDMGNGVLTDIWSTEKNTHHNFTSSFSFVLSILLNSTNISVITFQPGSVFWFLPRLSLDCWLFLLLAIFGFKLIESFLSGLFY